MLNISESSTAPGAFKGVGHRLGQHDNGWRIERIMKMLLSVFFSIRCSTHGRNDDQRPGIETGAPFRIVRLSRQSTGRFSISYEARSVDGDIDLHKNYVVFSRLVRNVVIFTSCI